MVAPTASSSPPYERASVRASAWLAVILGVLAVAAIPVAVAGSRQTDRYSYLEAGWGVAAAAVLGLAAIHAGRRGKKRERRAVLPVAGARTARWGRRLGWLGLYLAATGALALGVYALETHLSG